MATWPTLYNQFLRLVKKSGDDTLKSDFVHFCNLCSQDIQPIAGVDKTWSITIVADTESYSISSATYTDLYRAREGRFLATGGTDELAEYTYWPALKQHNDTGEAGFYIVGTTLYTPSNPSEGGTLKIHGDKLLAAIATTDLDDGDTGTPEIAAAYHDVYVWYAAEKYGAQKQDFAGDGRANYFGQQYQQRRRALAAHYASRRMHHEKHKQKLRW